MEAYELSLECGGWMIVFDLACECGFQFEGWFASHQDFTCQRDRQLLNCPRCGSCQVRKILSPVALATGLRSAAALERVDGSKEQQAEQLLDRLMHALSDYVTREYEDVGPCLDGEALKMHYGLEKTRKIRGVASDAEEEMLAKEGVALFKVKVNSRDDPEPN